MDFSEELSAVSSYRPHSFHPLNDATQSNVSLSRILSGRTDMSSAGQVQFHITSATPYAAPLVNDAPIIDRVAALHDSANNPLMATAPPLTNTVVVFPRKKSQKRRSTTFHHSANPNGYSLSAIESVQNDSFDRQQYHQRLRELCSTPYARIHTDYVEYCQKHKISGEHRDWNEDFQNMYTQVREGQLWGLDHRDRLRKLLGEFESHSLKLVERLFAEQKTSSAPQRSARISDEFKRFGNIVLRVWRDAKMGSNLQRSYNAVVKSRIRHITVPLTATFVYLSVSVTAFALIPLDPHRPAEYQALRAPEEGGIVNRPLEDYLQGLQEAMNILVGDGRADQRPAPLEVYEALDTRFYVVNPFGLLPEMRPPTPTTVASSTAHASVVRPAVSVPLFSASASSSQCTDSTVSSDGGAATASTLPKSRALPLRRFEHMLSSEACPPGVVPWSTYEAEIFSLHHELQSVLSAPQHSRNEELVTALHRRGLNVCLLGMLAQGILRIPRVEWNENTEPLLRCVESEIISRALRRLMLLQMTVEKAPLTLKSINMFLARMTGSLLQLTPATFASCLAPQIQQMFVLSESGDAELLFSSLETTVQEKTLTITYRLCQLTGLQMSRGAVMRVIPRPSKHNMSAVVHPELDVFHAQLVYRTPPPSPLLEQQRGTTANTTQNGARKSIVTQDASSLTSTNSGTVAFESAFVIPLRMSVFGRAGKLREAWIAAKQLIGVRGENLQRQFFNADAWTTAAALAATCGMYDDALVLVGNAIRVMETVPAYVISSGGSRPSSTGTRQYLPFNFYYLREQILLFQLKGKIHTMMSHIDEAEKCFHHMLSLVDSMDLQSVPYVASLRQGAVLGLFEITLASPDREKIKDVELLWVQEMAAMPPSIFSAHISELFGSLFIRREMYADACLRLWDAYQVRTLLLGSRSQEAAELLNKLSFVYSKWDIQRYGLYSSCLLHLAESILIEVFGFCSPNHVGAIENTIVLFMRRKMYVVASVRLHLLRTMPPRYAARIPRDHPAMIQLTELQGKLREEFMPIAVVMIQRFWRDYRERDLQRAVCESSACDIQRVGRAYQTRRMIWRLKKGSATALEIAQTESLYRCRNYSDVLLKASALFSRGKQNWCFEHDAKRLFGRWNGSVASKTYFATLKAVEDDFLKCVSECVAGIVEEPFLYQKIPDVPLSFVAENIAFIRISADDELAVLQNKLFSFIRAVPDSVVSAPLSTIHRHGDVHFFAVALIPLHKRPQFAFGAATAERTHNHPLVRANVDSFLECTRKSGLVWDSAESERWVEVVVAKNELFYFTNTLGLVSAVIRQQVPLESVLSLTHLGTIDMVVFNMCCEDKHKAATELLEQMILQATSATSIFVMYLFFLLCNTRGLSGGGSDVEAVSKLYRDTAARYEEAHEYIPAVVINCRAAREMIAQQRYKFAIDPLRRNLKLLNEKVRCDSYFASMYLLQSCRMLLLASVECDRPMEGAELRAVITSAEVAEENWLLFVTCEEFIFASKKIGDTDTTEALESISTQNAKEMSIESANRIVHELMRRSDEVAASEGTTEHFSTADVLLSAAIRISQAQGGETAQLGVLLCNYSTLMMERGDLRSARRQLGKAHHILSRETRPNSTELQMWKRCSRTLKDRIKENAVRIIRRAVRQWKERRRLTQELALTNPEEFKKLMLIKQKRLLGGLVVREGNRRVLVADAEAEERYLLQRRQHRMRQDAILKQTYGARLQLFLDKVSSAVDDLVEYALGVKEATAQSFWSQRHVVLTNFLLEAHKQERRRAFREMAACRIELKLWHIQNVDGVIRLDFLRLYQRITLQLVAAEETLWRRVIAKMQKKTKRLISRAIARAMKARPPRKNLADLINDLEYDEDMKRITVEEEEDQVFASMMEVFTLGPEVLVEDSDDD